MLRPYPRTNLTNLRIHDLELVAGSLHDRRAGLGTHADPVEPSGSGDRAVSFDGDFEALGVEAVDQRGIELEQRLAARDHDEALRRAVAEPLAGDFFGKLLGAGELGPAQEVRVTELADGGRTIFFAASPQVTSRKSQKHGGSTCICP